MKKLKSTIQRLKLNNENEVILLGLHIETVSRPDDNVNCFEICTLGSLFVCLKYKPCIDDGYTCGVYHNNSKWYFTAKHYE